MTGIRRILLTLSVACGFAGAFLVYSALLRPLTRLPAAAARAPELGASEHRSEPTTDAARIARESLPVYPWAADAEYQLKTAGARIYFNQMEPDVGAGTVLFKPFAIVWDGDRAVNGEAAANDRTTSGKARFALVSDSARIKFLRPFDLRDPDPGRVVEAALLGEVHVYGPDALRLTGRDFNFDERDLSFYSAHRVVFEMGAQRGVAGAVTMELISADGLAPPDRPQVRGIRSIRLNQGVQAWVAMKQGAGSIPLQVRTSGSCEYLVDEQQAVFRKHDGDAYRNDVRVYRPTSPNQYDLLECDQLTLALGPRGGETSAISAANAPVGLDDDDFYQRIETNLELKSLLAEGAGMKVSSAEQGVTATLTSLAYDAATRELVFAHPSGVQLRQRRSTLNSPRIRAVLDSAGNLASLDCQGPGKLEARHPASNEVMAAANWRGRLSKSYDPAMKLDLIELEGQALFRQPARKSGLGGETLRLWMAPVQFDVAAAGSGSSKSPPKTSTKLPSATSNMGVPLEQLDPKRLEAFQNVVLISPRFEAECDRLTAEFSQLPKDVAATSSPSANPRNPGGAASTNNPATPPIVLKGRGIDVKLAVDPKSGDVVPQRAEVLGAVRLTQAGSSPAKPGLDISGHHLKLTAADPSQFSVHLYGRPADVVSTAPLPQPVSSSDLPSTSEVESPRPAEIASLRSGPFHMRGMALHLDSRENHAWVEGAGELELPVKSGLDGKPLPEPDVLSVKWTERMSFDGEVAHFIEAVRAELASASMTCEQMHVRLDHSVKFAELARPGAPSREYQLRSIHCRDNVVVESRDYLAAPGGSQLIRAQRGQVAQFKVDQADDSVWAQGPGWMQMWSRKSTDAASVQQVAHANRPTRVADGPWEFRRIDFAGEMTGDLARRIVKFDRRVELLHGPVARPGDAFTSDELPELAGWMKSRELEVAVVSVDAKPNSKSAGASGSSPGRLDLGDRQSIEFFASGNVHLEGKYQGRSFTGAADRVSYDQRKDLFVLLGDGLREAELISQAAPGASVDRAAARRVEWQPDSGKVKAFNVTRADVGPPK